MVRIVELTISVCCGALGAYFGVRGAITLYTYVVHVSSWNAEEKVRRAKIRAKYFSIAVSGWVGALAFGLENAAALLFLPVFAGLFWLDFLIYRAITLAADRRTR